MSSTILVVEDEPAIQELIAVNLSFAGHKVLRAFDVAQAETLIRAELPDLILLDWMLPGASGLTLARKLRSDERTRLVPVIMLTAKGAEQDKVDGLEAGADDYMVKPFKPSELVARIRTRLRRTSGELASNLTLSDIAIDVLDHTITRGGNEIGLTRLEFDLLVALAKEPGRVFTREALLSEVWGYRHSTDTRLVNVHVQRLRAKIEHDPENPTIITTVRGIGYKAGVSGTRGH
jgi:two-component system response regulator MtrA